MTKQMTLKIRVDSYQDRQKMVNVLAANGFWVTEEEARLEFDDKGYVCGGTKYFVLVKGEFEVVEKVK